MKKIINNKEENVKNNIDNRKKKKDKKKKIGIFSKEKESYSFDEVFSITIFSLLLGVLACFSVLTILNKGKNYFVLSKELAKFVDAYDAIVNNYYKEVDKDKLVESAINNSGFAVTSRPIIAFCWLPPESLPARESLPSPERTSNFSMIPCVYSLISFVCSIPFLPNLGL